jgi:hypothetical protein
MMEVMFIRTGSRRYRVEVTRERAEDLALEPAPGYHDHIPHDLVHFYVEQRWGLVDGVYGQLAAGGDASMFRPLGVRNRRDVRKMTRRNRLSGQDIATSERLAALLTGAWEWRHAGRAQLSDGLRSLAAESSVSEADLDAAVAGLDELAARWHALGQGDRLRLPWRRPERRSGRRTG